MFLITANTRRPRLRCGGRSINYFALNGSSFTAKRAVRVAHITAKTSCTAVVARPFRSIIKISIRGLRTTSQLQLAGICNNNAAAAAVVVYRISVDGVPLKELFPFRCERERERKRVATAIRDRKLFRAYTANETRSFSRVVMESSFDIATRLIFRVSASELPRAVLRFHKKKKKTSSTLCILLSEQSDIANHNCIHT